jgi:hypothetical protein
VSEAPFWVLAICSSAALGLIGVEVIRLLSPTFGWVCP